MDTKRLFLYMALAMVGLSLWNAWQADYPKPNQIQEQIAPLSSQSALTDSHLLPEAMPASNKEKLVHLTPANHLSDSERLIQVKTDVLDLNIDLRQGDIVQTKLLDYSLSTDERNKPFVLLQNGINERYVAKSSLIAVTGQTAEPLHFAFSTNQKEYVLDKDKNQLLVALHGKSENGLEVTKEFVFHKGSYLIEVHYKIDNQSVSDWKGYLNTQLLRSSPKEDKSSIFHVGSYTGASYSSPGKHNYQKVGFSDMTKSNLDVDVKGGWVAMQQHYFLSAWVPESSSENKFYTRAMNGDYTIGTVSQPITLLQGQEGVIGSKLYLGPEVTSTLKSIAPSLDLTVDYGMLWFLSSLLFSIMKAINNLIGNWGWSIVLVTVFIKLAFYRLSATSYKSMAGMRKLQPKLHALRERYGEDKAKISQATMALYREEKVNPLGGCLPIVIQIPVFIALYWVLLESVELRQAPFIFWINDLASPDPFHVLPLIMGVTMLIQQKLNPAPPDPTQAKVMMFLPLLFTGLFWNFPSGLVLYWIVNNTLSILQQWYITRKYSDEKSIKKQAVVVK